MIFIPELPAGFLTPLHDSTVMEKDTITLECEVSKPDRAATWMKNGKPLETSDRIVPHCDGCKHFLIFSDCVLDDEAKYTIKIEEAESSCKLTVQGLYSSTSGVQFMSISLIQGHIISGTSERYPSFRRQAILSLTSISDLFISFRGISKRPF